MLTGEEYGAADAVSAVEMTSMRANDPLRHPALSAIRQSMYASLTSG